MAATALFRLPRELRDIIYKHYVAIDGGYICDTEAFINGKLKGANGQRIELSLVYTCKRIADEMGRGGLALTVNTITFSTLYSEDLRPLAQRFQLLKVGGLDQLRERIFHSDGFTVPDRAYSELKRTYPRLMPLLDRMREGGPRPRAIHHGPYGEAPSTYREFVKDTLRLASRYGEVRNEVVSAANNPVESWAIPSDHQLSTLQEITRIGPCPLHDASKYRFSAAAATIYFLQSIPNATRMHLRRIIINEDREAVSNPESHARGLIPFCQSNPLLRVERRVSLWRNVFHGDIHHFTPECRYNNTVNYTTPRFLKSDQITANVSCWIIEALALIPAGMPPASFSLVLDGDPVPQHSSMIFQSIVQRDVAWQSAWDECLKRGVLPPISWHERRGEGVAMHSYLQLKSLPDMHFETADAARRIGYWGYFFEDFPQAIKDMADGNGKPIVRCNFDIGKPWDVERVIGQNLAFTQQKWESEWFNHSPQYWDTEPPLPEWTSLLEDNVLEWAWRNKYGYLLLRS